MFLGLSLCGFSVFWVLKAKNKTKLVLLYIYICVLKVYGRIRLPKKMGGLNQKVSSKFCLLDVFFFFGGGVLSLLMFVIGDILFMCVLSFVFVCMCLLFY